MKRTMPMLIGLVALTACARSIDLAYPVDAGPNPDASIDPTAGLPVLGPVMGRHPFGETADRIGALHLACSARSCLLVAPATSCPGCWNAIRLAASDAAAIDVVPLELVAGDPIAVAAHDERFVVVGPEGSFDIGELAGAPIAHPPAMPDLTHGPVEAASTEGTLYVAYHGVSGLDVLAGPDVTALAPIWHEEPSWFRGLAAVPGQALLLGAFPSTARVVDAEGADLGRWEFEGDGWYDVPVAATDSTFLFGCRPGAAACLVRPGAAGPELSDVDTLPSDTRQLLGHSRGFHALAYSAACKRYGDGCGDCPPYALRAARLTSDGRRVVEARGGDEVILLQLPNPVGGVAPAAGALGPLRFVVAYPQRVEGDLDRCRPALEVVWRMVTYPEGPR